MAHNRDGGNGGGSAMHGGNNGMERNNGLKKGPWTATEDQILMDYVRKHGEGNWNSVQRNSGLNRCGKSCRLRWANHLRPNLKKGAFTAEEERLILELHAKYGNKWARMASQLPGRTDNEIKNYWNTRVKRRQRQGLPLYPHDIEKSQQQSQSHSQPTSLTIPTITNEFSPTSQNYSFKYQTSSYSHINPSHNPTSSSTNDHSFTFNNSLPILGAPSRYKRYRNNISPPISPTSERNNSILRISSMPDISYNQHFTQGNMSMPDMTSFQYQPSQNFVFDALLPPFPRSTSSQQLFEFGENSHNTRPLSSSQLVPQTHSPCEQLTQDDKLSVGAAANGGNCNNVLEEMLQEAEALAYVESTRKPGIGLLSSFEDKAGHEGHGSWLPTTSSTHNGLMDMNQIQDQNDQLNEDLSKLFSFIPSTVPVSDWYSSYSGEVSNGGQSSGATEASFEFDMKQNMASFFPGIAASSTDHDRVPNNWDNLHEMC